MLHIYKNIKKSKFVLTYMLFKIFLGQVHNVVVKHITHIMYGRKEGSFTVSHI